MVQTGVISGLTISIVTSGVQETHLTRDTGNWNTDGFIAGNKITIYNSTSNTSTYTVKRVHSATVLVLNEILTAESIINAVVLSSNTVLWNNGFVADRIRASDSQSIQHFAYLNLRARDSDDADSAWETNRVGLKLESVSITTSRVVPAFPFQHQVCLRVNQKQ
jgi:hypothetical protein